MDGFTNSSATFRKWLGSDERILWEGSPIRPYEDHYADRMSLFLAMGWTVVMLVVFLVLQFTAGTPASLIPLGVLALSGLAITRYRRRFHMPGLTYAITDRRILILETHPRYHLMDAEIAAITDLRLDGKEGSISFTVPGPTPERRTLRFLDDPDGVYRLLQDARKIQVR